MALRTALDFGYRLIDTAQVHGNEAIIGDVLREFFSSGKLKREDILITTKVFCNFLFLLCLVSFSIVYLSELYIANIFFFFFVFFSYFSTFVNLKMLKSISIGSLMTCSWIMPVFIFFTALV